MKLFTLNIGSTSTKIALFEGMEVFVPGDAEKYLTNLYGKNYMQLPPVEKRERHFIIDFDLNCSE